MKTVVFDVDGVLADFIGGAVAIARAMGCNAPLITTREHQHWDVYPGLDDRDVSLLWKYISEHPMFWSQLDPLVSASEIMKIQDLILGGNRVYFATNRNTPGAAESTREWIAYYLGCSSANIVITHRKGEFCKVVDADYYIDDKSENVDCAIWMTDKKTKAYVLTRPYNSGVYAPHSKKARRVATVAEFLEDVQHEV
jgi:5'(3')-deoxyribonucleotidase